MFTCGIKLFDPPERIIRESEKRKKKKKALSQARALFILAVCPTLEGSFGFKRMVGQVKCLAVMLVA